MGCPWQLLGAIRPVNRAVSKNVDRKNRSRTLGSFENDDQHLEVLDKKIDFEFFNMCNSRASVILYLKFREVASKMLVGAPVIF